MVHILIFSYTQVTQAQLAAMLSRRVLSALRGEGTKVDKSLIQGYKEDAHPVIPFSSADVPPVGE